ncbi:hypothetical protein ACMHYJ_14340 [Castellaniella hirudinis]|uniref:hypothetical protein n=1 Tax=Castellaniella hirudinis TaxID=1144617 RepID=UPI0039C27550
MPATLTPDEAFDADIPAALRDDIMTAISEAAHMGEGQHGCVHILGQDRLDAINVRAQGIVTVEGREYWFVVEDGNWNGTTLEGWEHSGVQTFGPLPRTQWALAPRPDLVSDAIAAGRGPFLVAKWDAFLSRKDVAEIPGKYTYDRMMQPGLLIERHYREAAAKYGFVIVGQEQADEIRARLTEASKHVETT